MSQILMPKRGREFAKDYNTINPDDSDTVRQAKIESWVAKQLGEELCRLYPRREWAVNIDTVGGMAVIICPDVSPIHGYHLKMNDTIEVLRQKMKAIGGEILERGLISRGRVTEDIIEAVPRGLREVVKGIDHG